MATISRRLPSHYLLILRVDHLQLRCSSAAGAAKLQAARVQQVRSVRYIALLGRQMFASQAVIVLYTTGRDQDYATEGYVKASSDLIVRLHRTRQQAGRQGSDFDTEPIADPCTSLFGMHDVGDFRNSRALENCSLQQVKTSKYHHCVLTVLRGPQEHSTTTWPNQHGRSSSTRFRSRSTTARNLPA